MKKAVVGFLVGFIALTVASVNVLAHCEVPCGIYDDPVRFQLIREHITTIEKAMKAVNELKQKGNNPNQLVRWILIKEKHANEIQHIVAQYFMTQRIKLGTAQYGEKLGQLHQMLVYSMKCKQTTDLDNVAKLRAALDAFEKLYKK
jgi:nickel superoxide dismutase